MIIVAGVGVIRRIIIGVGFRSPRRVRRWGVRRRVLGGRGGEGVGWGLMGWGRLLGF